MTPAGEAKAYRIWADCETFGWARTLEEIAESTGLTWQTVRKIMQDKGWLSRVKRVSIGMHKDCDRRWGSVPNSAKVPPAYLRDLGIDPAVRV